MLDKYIFFAALLLFSCSSGSQEKEFKSIVEFELNDDLNRFSTDHLICFQCEVGRFPIAVNEIVGFSPTSNQCKKLFDKKIDFFDPKIIDYKITTKKWDNRTTFIFTEEGVSYKDLRSIKGHYETMNIFHSKMTCAKK